MKPRTKIQKEVATLSARLPEITEHQKQYAYKVCFDHIGRKTKDGVIACTECGHKWKGDGPLIDALTDCVCPNCGTKLQVKNTRARVFGGKEYFSIITTCKEYQVVRFFFINADYRVGKPAKYFISEVVQRWITADGKSISMARLRTLNPIYSDTWSFNSGIEIRPHRSLYDICPAGIYPRIKVIPWIKRNGFDGEFHGIGPANLFTAILTNPRLETLLKAKQTEMLKYAIYRWSAPGIEDKYWSPIKICIRNGYTIRDANMWTDHIDLLLTFGKDTKNAKYVCPADLLREHNELVEKRNILHAREEAERRRRNDEQELRNAIKNQKSYERQKSRFFGLVIADDEIEIKALKSVDEFFEEGKEMHHCVFSMGYYKQKDSLILSARINDSRIETVEVSLKTLSVVQSRGHCNSNTEYHDRIVNLVNSNMSKISAIMKNKARKTA